MQETISELLRIVEEKEHAITLENIRIPRQNGENCLIDALLIHPKGIFVFRKEAGDSVIHGVEDADIWIRTVKSGPFPKREKFPNPIKKNEKTIEVLKNFLCDDTLVFHNVIIFPDSCNFVPKRIVNERARVICLEEIIFAVVDFCDETHRSMHPEKVRKLAEKLMKPTEETPMKICPSCGSLMRLTVATEPYQGMKLYVCSAFPKCREIELLPSEVKRFREKENNDNA